ncbi:Crp/Fnr family transcriptional regulator [Dysgonomonas sp. ZJ709]|uniref:Crp/Fnr family transcriptional regulator n=1 Tax=Dysgonomonas sp. ZJ709 TaxID=2709797 RepID=UPI0013EAAE90|nr:Crp/Fnr family transcriptional regulator [Dysgonomonas sp. ZJ709]
MDTKNISKCRLFNSMQETEIEEVLLKANAKEMIFSKGNILALQDEPCNRLIILSKGSVKAEMTDPSGKVVKVEDIHAPNPLAILFVFGDKNRFPVQVTAREDVTAFVISKQSILKALSLNEQFLKNYLDISANYATLITEKLHLMSFRTIRQKLAMHILSLHKNNNSDTIIMDKSQSSLAEYFGVSRPSLARELHNMQEDGLIVVDKKSIQIKNKNALIQLIHFS